MTLDANALSVAVDGLAYWCTVHPMPAALDVLWGAGRHPCGDSTYLYGLDPRHADAHHGRPSSGRYR